MSGVTARSSLNGCFALEVSATFLGMNLHIERNRHHPSWAMAQNRCSTLCLAESWAAAWAPIFSLFSWQYSRKQFKQTRASHAASLMPPRLSCWRVPGSRPQHDDAWHAGNLQHAQVMNPALPNSSVASIPNSSVASIDVVRSNNVRHSRQALCGTALPTSSAAAAAAAAPSSTACAVCASLSIAGGACVAQARRVDARVQFTQRRRRYYGVPGTAND